MVTPIIAGVGVAVAALSARGAMQAYQAWKLAPPAIRAFYNGGFEAAMSRREAALILGIRENAAQDKIQAAHRKIMIANHPDTGGSPFIASKLNEAKDMMQGKTKTSGSPFG
mmetsp:Transcript_34781/g.48221  ORF Transcript_34781/g.48221 Transcript_34781/m.48221 type:complete len:112 (-) Transcript_34781:154-489(-)|eukprot:CAMPEP_0196599182 /NCGR_PEP_ID=MMETSP1081-20130531/94724_1 /TAXON_ID=36882 /ORGANISM="Pyramimonas amylifera, Strain CCMP720" /LENGTH=111 /DNA_ID=CAMNT_0041924941 /DNA_START=1193 /DNA_END=1528 /DNA_ORIENTATION=+